MNIEILTPTITNPSICMRYTEKSSETYFRDWHIHDEYEMFYIAEGEKTYFVNDNEYPLSKGDIIFVNSNAPHKTFSRENSYGYLIQFKDDFQFNNVNNYLFCFAKSEFKDAVIFKKDSNINNAICKCLDNIIKEGEQKNKAHDIFIRSWIYNIYALLCRNDIINYPDNNFTMQNISKIEPALKYINNHYSEQITLDEISKILHIDKAHFCRIFKKITNTSFLQYLNFVRICHAENLLISTDKTISEISYDIGFNNVAYFIKVFKKFKNCTPSVYKKIKN